jgi:hypothetical protein
MILVFLPKNRGMKSKKEIFRALLLSAKTSCVLKIKLQNVPNPIITAVEKVEKRKIILKPTCLYGYVLRERSIHLHEIEGVTRYKTNFDNPLFVKLRFIKNNISAMRHNLEGFGQEAMLKRA